MRRLLILAFILPLVAQAPTRRPLEGPAARGWSMVTLDGPAQRQRPSLWISDETGRSVPFLEVAEGRQQEAAHPPEGLRLGHDAQGRPTAAFQLGPHPGGQRLRLQVEPRDLPWVAHLAFERQGPGGTWVGWEPRPRPHAWQLGPGDEGLSLVLPDEAGAWRLTLRPVVGRAPRLTGLTLQEPASAWSLRAEERLPLNPEALPGGLWRLALPEHDAIQRLEVHLRPPVAPLRAELLVPRPDLEGRPQTPWPVGSRGALWALPALESEATVLDLDQPFSGAVLLLRLPSGAEPLQVVALGARATFAFPVEPDHRYFLHAGGGLHSAPGSLGSLASSFDPSRATHLKLGAPQADPHAIRPDVPTPSLWERGKGAWPYVIGLLALALAAAAARLLKPDGTP
jgi:hypothetical protein